MRRNGSELTRQKVVDPHGLLGDFIISDGVINWFFWQSLNHVSLEGLLNRYTRAFPFKSIRNFPLTILRGTTV